MPISETATRVGVAAVAIPIAVAAAFAGGWILGVFVAVFAGLGALELFRMAARKDVQPLRGPGAAAAAGFVLAATATTYEGAEPLAWLLLVVLVLTAVTAAIRARGVAGNPLLVVSVTVFGAVYTGGLLSHGVLLRHLPGVQSAWHGTALVFAPLLLTWASDTSAYFVGRKWGRRKLIPRVSPGKTVEGSIGALVGTIIVASLYTLVLQQWSTYQLGLATAMFFGLVISVAAQVGDLAESLLKRDAGVKDSGTLFPGHGGVLDRVDSLLFTLPIAYLFFRFVVGPA
ncbi:MAG: phosphatidate cytidylyltransferase [Gemmatimonadetes bacterium]|nr:phosphatidate cytidylyltransferase [Gemmatimonadota bacterium]